MRVSLSIFNNGEGVGCVCVVLAMLVMPTLGWRWLLALSSVPSLCFLLVCAWLPESPRYMATGGHSDQATQQTFRF